MNPVHDSDSVFENSVATLLGMGFCNEKAIRNSLSQTNGNMEMTVEALLLNTGDQGSQNVFSERLPNERNIVQLPISQYTYGGNSSCTAISCEAVVKILSIVDSSHSNNTIITPEMLSDIIILGIEKYNLAKQLLVGVQSDHLSTDEYLACSSDTFTKLIVLNEVPIQGLLSDINPYEKLFNTVRSLSNPNKHTGLVLTKPPESISLVLPPLQSETSNDNNQTNKTYYLFDSHSRPHLGHDGAYLVTTTNLQAIIDALNLIFISFPIQDTISTEETHMMTAFNTFDCTVLQLREMS